jgi:uncharacterized membrane protein
MNTRQFTLPEANRVTQEKHRRNVLWQITLPLAVTLVIVIILAVLVSAPGDNALASRWSSISIVFMALSLLFAGIISLVLLALLAYGLARLLHIMPSYARLAQNYAEILSSRIKNLVDLLVKPIMDIKAFLAAINKILGWVFRFK